MGGLWSAIGSASNEKFSAYVIDFFDALDGCDGGDRPAAGAPAARFREPFCASTKASADFTTVSTACVLGSVR
ncbi:hypothetical protein D3C72_2357610 [compost metagenome]